MEFIFFLFFFIILCVFQLIDFSFTKFISSIFLCFHKIYSTFFHKKFISVIIRYFIMLSNTGLLTFFLYNIFFQKQNIKTCFTCTVIIQRCISISFYNVLCFFNNFYLIQERSENSTDRVNVQTQTEL